ncbi:hypothetical protein LY28_03451 [Ruminiclostridium sufflavum DSM 19573]|uniref:Uncharacterized protein n=1 Tax=Ruminiclostridium sufflavum DSM 19573 TaxID=1121337 RepID=A0A318XG62_9FIRM|nr:hypothetical protein [Ruminiclostridium sufflavum]PYG84917.1 hypothetical protein LY28_03451 [Ruminiclostridium sufflavum DSM 19573]
MNGEALWDSIISDISCSDVELQTTTGLWFRAFYERDKLYVGMAMKHTPSSNLSKQRQISKRDFLFVYSYYDRWTNGENGVRHEVSRKSRNTAYVFALIEKFK